MNFTEIITSVATICPIIIIVIGIISSIYHYIRKTKQENDEKIMSTIYRHKLISDYCEDIDNARSSIQPIYQEYKAMGCNGYLTQLYTPTKHKSKAEDPHVHNCINCGAPLKKDQHKCEYCGTEYF